MINYGHPRCPYRLGNAGIIHNPRATCHMPRSTIYQDKDKEKENGKDNEIDTLRLGWLVGKTEPSSDEL